jgi:hypothetical protein
LLLQSLTLQEALNVDHVSRPDNFNAPSADAVHSPRQAPTSAESSAQDSSVPAAFHQAAPLNEAEMLALLMASPLYQKLEKVKKAVANGALQNAPTSSGE